MLPNTLRTITVLLFFSLTGCGGGSDGGSGTTASSTNALDTAGATQVPSSSGASTDSSTTPVVARPGVSVPPQATSAAPSPVTAPPASLNLDPYYQKYLDADGIAVVAAAEVDDRALEKVRQIIATMLAKRKDVRGELVAASSRFLIIPKNKGITSLPEYQYLKGVPAPDGFADWDARARGMGGMHTSCGEENILKLSEDSYRGQGICVHEFAHTIHNLGLAKVEPVFVAQLIDHYAAIRQQGFIVNTYMATSVDEYWAMAVQAWYNAGFCRPAPDGVYGPLCDHQSLGLLDPGGYVLVNRVFNPPPVASLY
jgi:alpha-glucosidase